MTDEEKAYAEIERRYVENATKYLNALQAGWKECLDRASAKVVQDAFKQSEEKNGG